MMVISGCCPRTRFTTFAKFSLSAVLQLQVANPDLLGKFETGTEFYVDFTPAD